MRRFLKRVFGKYIIKLANRYSSRPNKDRVFKALTKLHKKLTGGNTDIGLVIPFDINTGKFIILSDQHKGARDSADDFALAAANYVTALEYYHIEGYYYINLGDSEELWENTLLSVKEHNKATFDAERKFLDRDAFAKIFGNHDLYWDTDPLAQLSLAQLYGKSFKVYEGLILRTTAVNRHLDIFMTHGHQGDLQSDGSWFNKWFVSAIWGPIQGYLRINPNTPANNDELKTVHNQIMYNWSAGQKDTILITGHTHQPVFASLTHIEHLYQQLDIAKTRQDQNLVAELEAEIAKLKLHKSGALTFNGYQPTYFNSGCCCFDDGDISGIEISDGFIRLIKWEYFKTNQSVRKVLQEKSIADLIDEISACN